MNSSFLRHAGLAGALSIITFQAVGNGGQPQPGKAVFDQWCTSCHGHNNGPELAGTIALQRKYRGQLPAHLEDRTDLSSQTVAYFVRHGSGSMPPFRKTEITDTDLAKLSAYLAKRPL